MTKRGMGKSAYEMQSDKLAAYEKRQSAHVHYMPVSVRARARQQAAARLHRNLKPMRFVSLHHHSTFSFLDGFQLPEAHVRRATEINMGAIALTEHGNIFSHVQLESAASAQGVKPIFGCEVYTAWTDTDRRTQRKNHLTLIARSELGYRNLMQLVTRSWAEGFYFEPTVNPEWIVEHKEGLIVLSGCQGSALFTALIGGKLVPRGEESYQRGLRVAQWFKQRFGDAYYVEVQAFPELDATRRANPLLGQIARDVGARLVATMDVHYTAPEEVEIQQVLHNVRPGSRQTIEEQVRSWGYKAPLCPPPTDRTIYNRLCETGLSKSEAIEAILSTEEIAQECHVELPKHDPVEYPLPPRVTSARSLWRRWLRKGWRYRGCPDLPPSDLKRYKAQLKKEMELIEAKGYIGYFLIVSDAVKYAKDHQIPVGPARGSAAASLVCWLLRITEVNPMLYSDLVFERFIDWSRTDMPDIDLDFATYGIPQVRDYLADKYGPECVSSLGTFTMYKPKVAIDDAARVHKVPKFQADKIKELLLVRSSGDLRASASIEDTIDQFQEVKDIIDEYPGLKHAMDLEGNVRGFGIHAAGLVISNGPITDVAAVLERTVNGHQRQVISMDKYDAERQGLEKLDFLGLKTMDMIAEVLRQIGGSVEDLYAIDLSDRDTIEGFRTNDVVGVFQFDGRATRIVNGALKPDTFNEVAITNALSRPGPLHNGAAISYIQVKHGAAEPKLVHTAFDDITRNTNYQIVFQEQILKIVTLIGNFDWTDAGYIRQIISKKLGDQEFNRQIKKFLKGAATLHERTDYPPMKEATARLIWGMCITAGSYAFNAAHAYSYGTLAFWTMYLKQHHPAAFYAASLAKMPKGTANDSQVDRHATLRRDATRHGLEVLPPDDESGASWRAVGKKTLVAGWDAIPGIGEKMATKIADYVQSGGDDLIDVPGVGPKTVARIEEFVASADPFDLYATDRTLAVARKAVETGILGDLPRPTHSALETLETTDANITILCIPFHRNLRDLFESNRARTGEALDPDNVENPELSEWVMMTCRDADEIVSLCFPRKRYPKFRKAIWQLSLNKDVILAKGRKMQRMKGMMGEQSGLIFVDQMWVINTEEE